MKKRLRKKLHVGEFCEYGLELELKITSSISETDFDDLMESFIEDYVEANGLYCGGSWNRKEKTAGMVVETGGDQEAAPGHAASIGDWLKSRGLEYDFTWSVLDLWYPERKLPSRGRSDGWSDGHRLLRSHPKGTHR